MTKRERCPRLASVGFAALMMLGFLPLGCGGGLGHVTARQEASNNRPLLPGKTVERLQACVAEYGKQVGPGHYRFNPLVRVDEEGYTHEVSMEDMPKTGYDFAACTRVALQDMALPRSVLNTPPSEDAVETMNRSLVASPVVVVVVVVELTEIVFEAAAYTFLFAVSVEVVKKAGPDIVDAARRRPRPNLNRCLDAAAGGGALWEDLCNAMPNSLDAAECWGKTLLSEQVKRNWCFNRFGN
jgi:hypothetical protein